MFQSQNWVTYKISFGSSFTFESRKTRVSLNIESEKTDTTMNNYKTNKF